MARLIGSARARSAVSRVAPVAALVLMLAAPGCTYYQTAPATPSGPSTFDRAWNAALAAASDVGVSVYSADRTSGVIRGTSGNDDVTLRVFTQADGRVRVEINVKGPSGNDAALAGRLSTAYDRNMGR